MVASEDVFEADFRDEGNVAEECSTCLAPPGCCLFAVAAEVCDGLRMEVGVRGAAPSSLARLCACALALSGFLLGMAPEAAAAATSASQGITGSWLGR